jgi:exosortase/archaeosortase family protein
MAALFLGELFRFSLWRRLALLGAGLALAFGCNVGRSLLLVSLFANKGREGLDQYHDKVGLGVLGLSLAGLAALAYLLRPATLGQAAPAAQAGGPSFQGRSLPRGALLLLLAWLAFVELGTEIWYRIHDSSGKAIAWTIDFPVGEPDYHEMPIPEVTQVVLRCNQERAAGWKDSSGNQWSMFFLRWFPGRASVQLARSHGPEICLPASGMTKLADLGVSPWQIGDVILDAHSYIFGVPGRVLDVFYCLAEDRRPGEGPASTRRRMTWVSRLEGVWAGRRNRGQQVLEMVVAGPADAGAARAETVRMLSEIIRPAARVAGS